MEVEVGVGVGRNDGGWEGVGEAWLLMTVARERESRHLVVQWVGVVASV